jgi:U3 small nucleolar RNA-associated protein 7
MGAPVSLQIRKEPKEVQKERKEEAAAANRARMRKQREQNESKKKMKGKNRPSRRQKKKQLNIIQDKKPEVKARMREQGLATAEHGGRNVPEKAAEKEVPENVPRALQRFYKKAR